MLNRVTLTVAAFAATLLASGTVASAAPLPGPSSAVGGERADITQAGWGCPWGFLPDGFGGCRRAYRRYGYGGGYGGGYGYGGPRPFYGPPRPFYRPYGYRPFY